MDVSRPYTPKFKDNSLNTADVHGYVLDDGRRFEVRKTKDGNNYFMELLSEGPVELLRHRGTFYVQENESDEAVPLLKKEGGTAMAGQKRVRVEKKPYVGVLRYMLRDCPALQPQIDATNLTASGMQELLKSYADCHQSDYTTFGSKLPAIGFDVFPTIGWASNSYEMSVNEFVFTSPDLESTNDNSYGVTLNIYFNPLSRRFSLVAGWLYHSSDIIGYSENMQDFMQYQNEVEIDYSENQFTFGLKYEIPWRPVTPYASAQFILLQPGKVNSTITRQRYNTSQEIYLEEEIIENSIDMKNVNAFQFAVGARLNILQNFNPFVEYRAAQFSDVFTGYGESSRNQQMILAGVVWSVGR